MKKKLGFCMCGSFCTHKKALDVMRDLIRRYDVVPIFSYNTLNTDTRFGTASLLKENVEGICSHKVLSSITECERLGPADPLDVMMICPCTGNTLAKIALGITDTPVTMAVKAHLRSERPLLIALATNDAMSTNFVNIGTLLNRKNVFFVPMKEDDPDGKPHSLVADFSRSEECLIEAENKKQVRSLFVN